MRRRWWWPFSRERVETESIPPNSLRPSFTPNSPWWWPFGKRARALDQQFREMLDDALLAQNDLDAVTKRLREHRKRKRGAKGS
jgi:hypothetical protein